MASAVAQPDPKTATATVVTQTRVRPEHTGDFAAWQQRIGEVVAGFGGLIDQQVIPPSPPVQPDWTIVQRFASLATARAWLDSAERLGLVEQAQPWLVGQDDVHVFEEADDAPAAEPVSAVISTRVAPDQEEAFRAWQRKIAAHQATFPGFQGYKLAPPVPGVHEDWVTILRFDTAAHLDAWMTSPIRQELLKESAAFTDESRVRLVRTGFDAWFGRKGDQGVAVPPAWKQNMIVLLGLYPVVFLFGEWVQTPLLMDALDMPFWLALFVGNVAGVLLLALLIPRLSRVFGWWLQPVGSDADRVRTNRRGAALVVALYVAFLILFSQFP